MINSFPRAFEPARYAVLQKTFRAPLKASRCTHPKYEPGSSSSVRRACNITSSAANHWGISLYSWPCHPSPSSTQAGLPPAHLPVSGSVIYPSCIYLRPSVVFLKTPSPLSSLLTRPLACYLASLTLLYISARHLFQTLSIALWRGNATRWLITTHLSLLHLIVYFNCTFCSYAHGMRERAYLPR